MEINWTEDLGPAYVATRRPWGAWLIEPRLSMSPNRSMKPQAQSYRMADLQRRAYRSLQQATEEVARYLDQALRHARETFESGPGTKLLLNYEPIRGPWMEPSPPSNASPGSTSLPETQAGPADSFKTLTTIPPSMTQPSPSTADTSSGSMAEAASGSTGRGGEDAAPDGDPRGRVTSIPCDHSYREVLDGDAS